MDMYIFVCVCVCVPVHIDVCVLCVYVHVPWCGFVCVHRGVRGYRYVDVWLQHGCRHRGPLWWLVVDAAAAAAAAVDVCGAGCCLLMSLRR